MCLTDLKANDETVGMWNFVDYRGTVPGTACPARLVPRTTFLATMKRATFCLIQVGQL